MTTGRYHPKPTAKTERFGFGSYALERSGAARDIMPTVSLGPKPKEVIEAEAECEAERLAVLAKFGSWEAYDEQYEAAIMAKAEALLAAGDDRMMKASAAHKTALRRAAIARTKGDRLNLGHELEPAQPEERNVRLGAAPQRIGRPIALAEHIAHLVKEQDAEPASRARAARH